MEGVIRWAVPEDKEQLGALYDELQSYHANINPEKYETPLFGLHEKVLEIILQATEKYILVHENGGVLDAYAFLTLNNKEESRKSCLINELFVAEPARRRGIGTAMIDEIHRYARENKLETLRLEVEGNNPSAIEFYKNVGFSQQSIKISMEMKI